MTTTTTTTRERRKIRRAVTATGPHQRTRLLRALWRFYDVHICAEQPAWGTICYARTESLLELARYVGWAR